MKRSVMGGLAMSALALALLAGCTPPDKGHDMQGDAAGLYGDDPNGPPPGKEPFAPKIYAVAYLKFVPGVNGPTLKAQHAYFDLAGGKPDVAGAVAGFRSGKWGTTTPIGDKVRSDFEDFGFNQQAKLFVVFDDKTAAIADGRPVRFSEYRPADVTFQTKLDRNKTFYNAKVSDFGDAVKAIEIDNYFNDKEGKPIKQGERTPDGGPRKPRITNYEITFNYTLASAASPSKGIPFVIDPDTGNGYDDPPP